MNTNAVLRILLAEDNADDVFFFNRLFQKTGFDYPVDVATDGDKLIDYLTARIRQTAGSPLTLPLAMFIDLKLPRTNGFEILQWLQEQPKLRHCLRVVLTSSDQERDVVKAFELGAHCYLVKYPSSEDLASILTTIGTADASVDLAALELPGLKRPLHSVLASPKL